MIKTLYANGCSWTVGNGLPEDINFPSTGNHGSDLALAQDYTWPSIIAKKLSCDVVNDAEGGGSNKRILRTTCNYLMDYPKEKYNELLVMIGWTSIERDEIYIQDEWHKFNARQDFSTYSGHNLDSNTVKNISEYQKMYVTNVYHQEANLVYYFQQLYLLSNLLENLGIKYIFFNGLSTHKFHSTVLDLNRFKERLEKIKTPSMLTETAFSIFCHEKKLPLSTCMHPMIEAQAVWAEYLYNNLTTVYTTL